MVDVRGDVLKSFEVNDTAAVYDTLLFLSLMTPAS